MPQIVLRPGSKGQFVADMQEALVVRIDVEGMPTLQIDGDFGPNTTGHVVAFQRRAGLSPDGIAGSATLQTLGCRPAFGVDLSHWQPQVDFAALRAAGVQFVGLKAAHGQHGVDKTFAARRVQARDAGLPAICYGFAVPRVSGGTADPDVAAQNLLELLGGALLPGELVPAEDLEAYTTGMSPADVCAWGLEYLQHIKQALGSAPILYTGAAFLRYQLAGGNADLAQFPLWLARYHGDAEIDPQAMLGAWKRWRIWQFTRSGRVPGVANGVDCNWLAGGQAGIDALRPR